MPFNGSGVFSIINTFVPGTTILSSAVNANFADIATGLSTAILKNGTQTITADLPMSGFGFTGLGSIASQPVITVASNTTTDILSQDSLLIAISGTNTITNFGADTAARRNQIKFVRTTDRCTITYSGTLITPAATDLECSEGDTFVVISDASSACRIYAYQRVTGFPVISYPGFRNIVRRNGGCEIWQRGAGGAASFALGASAGTPYTADGWYLNNGANQACVVSQQAGISDGSQWSIRIVRNAGQAGTGNMWIGFPLDTDEIYPLQGQFVRLSFVARAGSDWSPASGVLNASLSVGVGGPAKLAGFTTTTTPIFVAQTITTTPTRYFPAAGVIPLTSQQAEIDFSWVPVGAAGADDSVYIDDVQLEVVSDSGQIASPFERLIFEEQLALCQMHYFKTLDYNVAPAQNAGSGNGELNWGATVAGVVGTVGVLRYPVPMRTLPTITLMNPGAANAEARNISSAADCTATSSALPSKNGISVVATQPVTATTGTINGINIIADAGI